MIGCLTAPFRALGCLVLIAALLAGWLYRDRVARAARDWLHRNGPGTPAPAVGRPGTRALASARSKIDSLNGWGADSVVLTASELASLVGDGMDREVRSQLDSLRVEPLDGEIRVRARLRTARLPSEVVGTLAIVLRPTEPVEAVGPLRVLRPALGEWGVRSVRIRDVPLPADLVPGLVARVLGEPGRRSVPVRVPEGVRDIRLRRGVAILYGATRS